MCNSCSVSVQSRIGYHPALVSGPCFDCGEETTNLVCLNVWYYLIKEFMCPSCVRLTMENYPTDNTDGQLDEDDNIPTRVCGGFTLNTQDGEVSIEQAIFERSMVLGGLLLDVAE